MQKIAAENNLAETAFFVPRTEGFELRWFTPTVEMDLCGHATIAPALVLFAELNYARERIEFHTRSGLLTAERRGKTIELNFPSRPAVPCPAPAELLLGLKTQPREILRSRDYLVVYEKQAEVAALAPDMALLAKLDCVGVIVTAIGDSVDFVSRFFAPAAGVPEDPATGSSHSTLIPFWSERLNKTELFARQISRRGGEMHCRLLGDRVGIGGEAIIYGRGTLEVPDSCQKA